MKTYLDISFLIKLYVFEPESLWAIAQVQTLSDRLVSNLTDIEVASTLYRNLAEEQAKRSHGDYVQDCRDMRFRKVLVNGGLFVDAVALAHRFSGPLRLRSLDLLHLATALHYGASAMATYDGRLRLAAEACGMSVVGARP